MWIMMILSGDDFAHAMIAELLWHVLICHLIGSLQSKPEHDELL